MNCTTPTAQFAGEKLSHVFVLDGAQATRRLATMTPRTVYTRLATLNPPAS